MQKAIIVHYNTHTGEKNPDTARPEALQELNTHLSQGWQVKSSYPMSGTAAYIAAALVILEK